MLPPTCTRVVPSASWTSRAKQLFTLPTKKKGKSSKAKAAKTAAATGLESDASASGMEDHSAGEGKAEEEKSDEQQLSRQVGLSSRCQACWAVCHQLVIGEQARATPAEADELVTKRQEH